VTPACPDDEVRRVAETYRRFARIEARGVSPIYDEWASSIADDDAIASRIASLPGIKRQPNLVFAAARLLGAPVRSYAPLREWLMTRWDDVVPVVLSHATQTNEAGRCAVLLPVLSSFDEPLALIEAGASAGLVLYPDRYGYRYETADGIRSLDPVSGPSAVRLPCEIDAAHVPTRLPDVAWRAGADLNPIDVEDAASVEWLEALVWPEHDERRARLHAAARIAAADPPRIVAGDIVDAVPRLVEEAPPGARIIVFHSAVLVYLTPERRAAFVELMRSLPAVTWISNEGAGVLPDITRKVRADIAGRTILAVDGEPVALVGPHGQSFEGL